MYTQEKKKVVQALVKSGKTFREVESSQAVSLGYIHKAMQEYNVNDKEIQHLANKIQEREIMDRRFIEMKTSLAQHKYLDDVNEGRIKVNPIAVTAIRDRNFYQTRLLEDKSTQNIAVQSKIDAIMKIDKLLEAKIE